MCGIAGIVSSQLAGAGQRELAERMSGAIAHRGPDDSGIFVGEDVTLAHRRLSIIDLSACGHQPMTYADGRYTITYNGEIYNFADLRRELEGRGHRFASHSDTEVILAAYAEWGEECVKRLRGMFSFAIHDRDARGRHDAALFLARDRFGIKPLYFAFTGSAFLFASELRAILATDLVPRRLDTEAVWTYLSLGSMPQPRTAIAGVEMLPAARTMTVRRDLSFEIRRYWDLADAEPVRSIDAIEAARRTRELLEESTRLHMVADVPVGAFLSGGIDSTAVVGLMTRVSSHPVRTFSVGFADDASVADERADARIAAQRFGSEHTEVVVSGEEVARQFDDLVGAIDQPSLDGTNTFLISKAVSRELKVALSGLGGDELFAGYPHFRRLQRAARFDRLRRVARFVPGRFLADKNLVTATTGERYATLRNLAGEGEKSSIISSALASSRRPLAGLYAPLIDPRRGSVAQTTYVETTRYLADTLLRDTDAMSMHWSLEVRPVLLDHKLAEFAYALPDELKIGALNKPVLVDAVRDILPPELLSRKKTGFELPLQNWLTTVLRDRALDAFSSSTAGMLFSDSFLAATTRDLRERRRPHLRLWAYLILVEWVRALGVTA